MSFLVKVSTVATVVAVLLAPVSVAHATDVADEPEPVTVRPLVMKTAEGSSAPTPKALGGLDAELVHEPPTYDVEATISAARSEVGTWRATGFGMPGECIMSAKRWVHAGGGAWTGSGSPRANYAGAREIPIAHVVAGDIVQYEPEGAPHAWVMGVHTVLVTGVNGDGTLSIIESNWVAPGLVTEDSRWLPAPPPGFRAVAWRF